MPCPPRTLAALALSIVGAVACGADSPQSGALEAALAGELERLSAVLEAAAPTLPEALAGELESQRQALVAARRIEAAPLLLHRLAEVGVGVESLSFVAGHLDAAGDLARLETLWTERGPRFAAAPIAVESERAEVEETVRRFALPGRVVVGDDTVEHAFGGVAAVPTLFLADRDGRIVRAFYGAPPDLHRQIEEALAALR
jgi:hypothetical protein